MMYSILVLPFLVMFTWLLLTNVIIPHFKKKALYAQIQARSDGAMIKKTDHFLKHLYKGVHAKIISIIYRRLRCMTDKEFIYGEIDFLSFYTILEKAQPQPTDVFYDLGSGAGKAVFTAALFFDLSKSCGIELLPPLYKKANKLLKKATLLAEKLRLEAGNNYSKQLASIQFINNNFLHYDLHDADIIYIAATCLSDSTWIDSIKKMAELKPGSRIIVATKRIQHENFELIFHGVELMSWGLCPVSIYKIVAPQQLS